MCCSLHPAKLTNTILYAAETVHQGNIVHVLGYQNRAENLFNGPNAMLLPIPSDIPMGPDNMLDTTAAKSVLKDYANAVRAQHQRLSRGMTKSLGFGDDRVQVFDKGGYTVALADDAKSLTGALSRIPENRRPSVNAEIFAAYDYFYPKWKMALCAWDGALEAAPLLWWYQPKTAESLFMPALDAHDGRAPKLGSDVSMDHTLIVGSVVAPPKENGIDVVFTDMIPAHLKPFLATTVVGQEVTKMRLKNGDFSAKVADIHKNGAVRRITPPGMA